jgi:uncharacterized protein (TIGR02611 family)
VPLLEPIMRVLARFARRGAIFVVGVALLVAGAAMMVLPGPGIATVLLGLIVLAKEFSWARRALAWARQRALELKDQAQARMPGAAPRPRTDPPPGRDRPDQAA